MPSARIAAGKLRWQVQILQPTVEQDSSGGVDPLATSTFATVWAAIEALTGRELYAAQQRVSEITHKITIRYMPGVLSLMSVLFDDPGRGLPRVFLIADVLNPDETPHLLYLYCVERDDSQQVAGQIGAGASAVITSKQPVAFTADGSTDQFTLPQAPGSLGIILFWNGLFSFSPGDYSVSGSVITTARTPAPGDLIVVFYLW
jgi:SPP1 family predicted phage head-tail adaptor